MQSFPGRVVGEGGLFQRLDWDQTCGSRDECSSSSDSVCVILWLHVSIQCFNVKNTLKGHCVNKKTEIIKGLAQKIQSLYDLQLN